MGVQLSMTEHLMYSTIRIECFFGNGVMGTGTGFFFTFCKKEKFHIPVIVTNKHVIRGAIEGIFRFTVSDGDGNPLNNRHEEFQFSDFESLWIMHPDPKVDLCIMPIAKIIRKVHERGVNLFYVSMDKSFIPSQEEGEQLTAMENIIMIGYPNGIWDSVNNLPILRRGITATHPKFNYEGKEEFMIDAACFPGSSGSPVLLLNIGSYPTRDSEITIGNRLKLLGILYAGPQYAVTGEIRIENIPVRQKSVTISRIPNNLGNVIKANKILDFEGILKITST